MKRAKNKNFWEQPIVYFNLIGKGPHLKLKNKEGRTQTHKEQENLSRLLKN
jgi:hypothetical protein